MSVEAPQASAELVEAVEQASWYHGMRLPGGIVTSGKYDLDDAAGRIPFPASLVGQRCLDVGTRDGFWAFEMERRGAAEVIGIDLDDPSRLDFPEPRPELSDFVLETELERRDSAFAVAHRALGSGVRRLDLSVYDLGSGKVGEFDFAFIGTLLLHLRDPVGALTAMRSVLRPGGTLITNDPFSIPLTLARPRRPGAQVHMRGPDPFWWIPNIAGRRRMVEAAGLDVVSHGRPYLMRYGSGWRFAPRPSLLRTPGDFAGWLAVRFGAPHTCIVARRPTT